MPYEKKSDSSRRLSTLYAIVLMLIIAPCVSACRTVEKIETVTQTHTDTMIVERRTVDTLVITAPDSATLDALWECDSMGNVLMSQLATAQGNRLNIEPRVRYVYVQDTSGHVRRKAYFSALATTDSLQQRIYILEETLRRATHTHATDTTAVDKKPGWNIPTVLILGLLVTAVILCALYETRDKDDNNNQ